MSAKAFINGSRRIVSASGNAAFQTRPVFHDMKARDFDGLVAAAQIGHRRREDTAALGAVLF